MSNFDSTCWNCKKLAATDNWRSSDINGSANKVYCSHHGFVDPFSKKCSSYENAYRSESYIEACQKALWKKNHYYIVSTTCRILGLPEDCEYMQAFELVLDNYIKETNDGEQLLDEYDIYGCMVANRMMLDFNRSGNPYKTSIEQKNINKENVVKMVNEVIEPQLKKMTELVKKGNVKSAILRYIVLTRKLMDYYNISYEQVSENEYNYENKSIVADTLEKYKSFGTR